MILTCAQIFNMKELPEIIFASSDPTQSRKIKDWIRRGKIRRLIPRVYTSNLVDAPDMIIKRNIWSILSQLFPGTIISHRTALELKISPANSIYLTGNSRRIYRWPGVNLRFTDGPSPLDNDSKAFMNLYVSSFERACLENLSSARLVEHERRVVDREIVEDRLADLLNTRGESALNQVRDTAREIANSFGWSAEFEKLNGIISSLLSSRLITNLKSSHAISTAIGEPYDASRIELFSELIAELNSTPFADRREKTETLTDFTNFAFFEAYFSNYIEGTTFLVEEAIDIIFNKVTIQLRLEDSHDIRGTYDVASNRDEMEIQPSNSDEFIDLLKSRHKRILFGRPEQNPGIFKTRQNRAGESFFVEPQFVMGTLKKAFSHGQVITDPLARAIYIMFVVSEVHPFDDGNGRIARIMMNSELVAKRKSKIIVPNVFREDYMLALRNLTRRRNPKPFIRMNEPGP